MSEKTLNDLSPARVAHQIERLEKRLAATPEEKVRARVTLRQDLERLRARLRRP
jgi:predicted component of type VI protein secretion system